MTGVGASAPHARGVYACVVDSRRRFHLEALRWFASLTEVAGVAAQDLVIGAVGATSSAPLRWLAEQGVKVHPLKVFDGRKRHTNKIAGALALARAGVQGVAVMTDTDVAICEDMRSLPIGDRAVGMKIVDIDNPPFETVQRIFDAAGLPLSPVQPPDFAPDRLTVSINGNGGVYLVPGSLLPELAARWERWAHWLLERLKELGLKRAIDQMSMALSIAELGLDVFSLERRFNLPTHVPEWIHEADAPAVLHYHQSVDRWGLVATTGNRRVDERIAIVNDAIAGVYDRARRDAGVRVRRPVLDRQWR